MYFPHYTCLVVRGRDPSAVAVLAEDGAAVAGLLIAASCLGLTSYTGNVVYDAVGSIAIGGTRFVYTVQPLRKPHSSASNIPLIPTVNHETESQRNHIQ